MGIYATLASETLLYFRKNLLEKIKKLVMAIDDKIRDEILHYNINREVGKISTLPSRKTDKYEFPKGEEMLLTDQRRVIDQAKFAYFFFGESFWKANKYNWRSRNKISWSFIMKFMKSKMGEGRDKKIKYFW